MTQTPDTPLQKRILTPGIVKLWFDEKAFEPGETKEVFKERVLKTLRITSRPRG